MMDRPSHSLCPDEKARELFDRASSVIDTDSKKAESLLREAAGMGCTASMVLLGDLLIDGDEDQQKEAISLFRKAYRNGDDMGSRNLGYCYAVGIGVNGNKRLAAKWYTRSAEAGNAKAQCNMGVLCEYGHGVKKDYGKAAEWFRMSAENGYHRGRTNYACLLRDGNGVPKDPEKAVYWFEQSGSPRAKRLLAQMYMSGEDIGKDVGRAKELLESASDKDRKAMFLLGDLIYPEEKDRAIGLFNRSAEKGFEPARERLEELGLEVPPKTSRF